MFAGSRADGAVRRGGTMRGMTPHGPVGRGAGVGQQKGRRAEARAGSRFTRDSRGGRKRPGDSCATDNAPVVVDRRVALAGLAGVAGLRLWAGEEDTVAMAKPAATGKDARKGAAANKTPIVESFLRKSGGKGFLVDEEERLIQLRQLSEATARKLDAEAKRDVEDAVRRARVDGEMAARKSFEENGGNFLCATPYGIDVVGISQGIALVGALVGGISAKNRKDEVQKLNEQLRRINMSLRKQSRSGTVYAPNLVYAPPSPSSITTLVPDQAEDQEDAPSADATASLADAPTAPTPSPPSPPPSPGPPEAKPSGKRTVDGLPSMGSMEEESRPMDDEVATALKKGRRLLEQSKGATALVHFEKALMLSRARKQKVQERRAERGLAAACRLQRQYQRAIGHLLRVLEISQEMDEFTGDGDAYGSIADIYTDIGDLEKAAKYYDLYIERMNN